MLKADELLVERERLLVHFYWQRIVGSSSAVKYGDVEAFLGLEERDVSAVIESLEEAGLVKVSGAARKFEGTSYGPARFWLTAAGLEDASWVVSEIREQPEPPTKRPIGFPEPGDKGSSEEEV